MRPDQSSATVRLHYLADGNANFAFTINRAEYFVPVALLLKGLAEVPFLISCYVQPYLLSSAALSAGKHVASQSMAIMCMCDCFCIVRTACWLMIINFESC